MLMIQRVTKYLTLPHSILSLRGVCNSKRNHFELAPGECSSPQHLDEVSDDSCSVFSDISNNYMVVDEISVDESPSRPKWDEKIIQVAWELMGNSLEPRKTKSQIHNASYESESSLAK